MEIRPLEIADVKLIIPRIYRDGRGFFSETYNRRAMSAAGVGAEFVQDNHSLSAAAGTIRGLHYQLPPYAQGKLMRVIRGSLLDVAVDIRAGSPTFGQHVSATLSAGDWTQIWIPPGFAHGYCTLEPNTEVIYKVTEYYAPDFERGILWDDADLGIDWPVASDRATLSEKDLKNPLLRDVESPFEYSA
ncbi:MAG: dTDP-4-dehydrorhamnose 3,5-epimerase [Bradyrhizobium sp.]|uniref:dTDP-4-dehydrorhamnose 3,5-epimerase n=1 Tax=Bradyrhizobium sp. TaxID=376 RepID=UPI00273156FA|nr:dTDP-4-dehydrorhamnose 3,5-epimerase [Bradyrhizobium sp.]MDP1867807.1 dTDP-4-dehydrorhamnose 3,5-epimerase [Bradyrhizobium sp.]